MKRRPPTQGGDHRIRLEAASVAGLIAVAIVGLVAMAYPPPQSVFASKDLPVFCLVAVGIPISMLSAWAGAPREPFPTLRRVVRTAAPISATCTLMGSFAVGSLVAVAEASDGGPLAVGTMLAFYGTAGVVVLGIPAFIVLLVPSMLWASLIGMLIIKRPTPGRIGA
jgi:hypothetical protein